MDNGIEFFTATCLNWQPLLLRDERKDIVMDSLKFLVNDNRIWLYGFVIMPNHIHLMWHKQAEWANKSVAQMFLKYTAQQIKFSMLDKHQEELESYRSTQSDRQYHFWERRSYPATMYNRKVAGQKIDYMHYNPVKTGLCQRPEDYHYSSARYYELNIDDWGSLCRAFMKRENILSVGWWSVITPTTGRALYKSMPSNSLGLKDVNLKIGSSYNYRVKVIFVGGNESSFSEPVQVKF